MGKRDYAMPMMILEEFVAEQYVAADDCTIHVSVSHGHFTNNVGETHCAFTASNCGSNAESCQTINQGATANCNSFSKSKHQVITEESGTVIKTPNSNLGYHNCHVISSNDAARSFINSYSDRSCANGVAALMGLSDTDDIQYAMS